MILLIIIKKNTILRTHWPKWIVHLAQKLHSQLATGKQEKDQISVQRGRKQKLTAIDQILLLFFWFRHYCTKELLSYIFKISVTQVSHYLHFAMDVVMAYYQGKFKRS